MADVGVVPRADRTYWLLQLSGWGLYTVYVLTFTLYYEGIHVRPIVSVIGFLFVLCPLVCHGLRHWMLSHGWLTLPTSGVLPRAAAAVLAVSFVLTVLTGAFNIALQPDGRWRAWWPAPLVGIFWGYVVAFGIWIWIYFNVHERRRRRALEVRALQLEVGAREARLRTLESQLNPHFLFNCLNSVRALVAEDPPRAQAMITRLAELLRYTLRSDQRDVVTLDEELRAAQDYLALERVRFEERLQVDVAVDADARRQLVPRMLVLTLVENAVKHGISRLTRGGRITIAGTVDDGRLRVDVTNSGTMQVGGGGERLGLRNARERLRLIYGDQASLTVDPSTDGQVTARVSIPARAGAAVEATA